MSESEITNEERKLLEQYQTLSPSMPSLINRVAIEAFPPIVFIVLWYFTGNVIFLIVVIVLMAIYNVQRVLRQYKNIMKLTSISEKTIGKVDDNKA